MSAYNWILSEQICPNCHKLSMIKSQTHIASSFDGIGEERFCQASYRVNQKMKWFPPSDYRHDKWDIESEANVSINKVATERCYSFCSNCDSECMVIVEIDNLLVVKIGKAVKDNN